MDYPMHVSSFTPAQPLQRTETREGISPAGSSGKSLPASVAPEGNPPPSQADPGRASRGVSATQVTQAQNPNATASASSEEVGEAVERINDFVQVVQRDLRFTVDEDTGRTVVKVMDAQSEELIRQLPPEEILELAAYMDELRGLLVKEKA